MQLVTKIGKIFEIKFIVYLKINIIDKNNFKFVEVEN